MSRGQSAAPVQSIDETIAQSYKNGELRELLAYPADSAGGLMTPAFVSIAPTLRADQAIAALRKVAETAETVNYVYVTDPEDHLLGVLSLHRLVLTNQESLVRDLMFTRPITALVTADQEDAAKLLTDNELLALPVVDEENHILGIITVDDITEVLEREVDAEVDAAAVPLERELGEDPLAGCPKGQGLGAGVAGDGQRVVDPPAWIERAVEAQRQRRIAENRAVEIQRQKDASDKSARANRLAAMALQKGKTDYTMGWHLAYLAYQASFDSAQGGSTEPGVSGIMHDIVSDQSQCLYYKTLEGHTDYVYGAVFSPDGQFILTCSRDNTARLWGKNGMPLKTLEGHTSYVNSAVFSPEGQFILTCSADNTARLWDKNGMPLKTLEGHTYSVSGAVSSPDGQSILTCSADKTARLWEPFPLYIQHHWSLHRKDFLEAGVREEDLPAWVK